MENIKTTGVVIDEITKIIKEEIDLAKDLTKQQFSINVEYLEHCSIISLDAVDINNSIKKENDLYDPEAIITGDIHDAISEIIYNR